MKKKLKDVCDFYSGTGFPTQYQGEDKGDYPFYKVSDIAKNVIVGNIYLELCSNYIDDVVVKKIKGCILPENTVVFAKIGEALKLNRRAITSCACLVDNNVMGIAPRSEVLRIQYFYFLMKNLQLQTLAESTTVPSVRKTRLEKYEIEVPSLLEQEEIEKKLIFMQKVITKRKLELLSLDNLVKARFVEMFVDRGYPVKTIGDVIDRKITRVAKAFDKTDVIQYLDISSIDSSSKTVKKLTRYILAEAPSRAQYVLKYNDIMYSTVRPNLQNVAINTCSEENVVGSTGFCILRCIGVTVGYMWGVMNSISFTEAMTNQATGASYPAVTDKVVYSYKIPIPPKEEQIVYEQLVRQIAKSKLQVYQYMVVM